MVFVGEVTTLTTAQFVWMLLVNLWWLWIIAILFINSHRLYKLTKGVHGKAFVKRTTKAVREDVQKIRGTYPSEVRLRKSRRPA